MLKDFIAAIAAAIGDRKNPQIQERPGDNVQATHAVTAPVVDWDVIECFRANCDEEALRILIDTFLVDAANKLKRFAAIANAPERREEAARIAHSLKSASAMAGAMALSKYAANVEAQTHGETIGVPSNEDALEMQRLFLAYRKALVDRRLQSPL